MTAKVIIISIYITPKIKASAPSLNA